MSSRPPFRRANEGISNVEMHSVGSDRHRAATGAIDEEKDAGAGFNITDSFGSENPTKIEDTQFGEVEPIHSYVTDNELATRNNKYNEDPFGNEEGNKVKYKTLTWWYVPLQTMAFMVVSNM